MLYHGATLKGRGRFKNGVELVTAESLTAESCFSTWLWVDQRRKKGKGSQKECGNSAHTHQAAHTLASTHTRRKQRFDLFMKKASSTRGPHWHTHTPDEPYYTQTRTGAAVNVFCTHTHTQRSPKNALPPARSPCGFLLLDYIKIGFECGPSFFFWFAAAFQQALGAASGLELRPLIRPEPSFLLDFKLQ